MDLKTKVISVICSIFIFSGAVPASEHFTANISFAEYSESSIYSIQEDSSGAMWLYTDIGLVRFNGHSTALYEIPLEKGRSVYNGSDKLYVISRNDLYSINPLSPGGFSAAGLQGIAINGQTAILADGDSLLISDRDKIYVEIGGDLSLYSCMPDSSDISSIEKVDGGVYIVGTSSGVFILKDGIPYASVPTDSAVSGLFAEPGGQTGLAGLAEGGLFRFSIKDGSIITKYRECEGKQMQIVRSFCLGGNGNIYIGASNGLFRLSPDNGLSVVPVDGDPSIPVYSIYSDSEGNLWACTIYDGVVYADLTSYPFSTVPLPASSIPRGLTEDSEGTVWAATDGHGLYRYVDESWELANGTDGLKYQRLFMAEGVEGIIATDWYGNLIHYTVNNDGINSSTLNKVVLSKRDNQVRALHKFGDEYFVGSKRGLFAFNPEVDETVYSRPLDCGISPVNDIIAGPGNRIWVSGYGLGYYSNGSFTCLIESGGKEIRDIAFDDEGQLWGCMENQLFMVNGEGEVDIVKVFGGNHLQKLSILPDGHIFILTNLGVIIYDTVTGDAIKYGDGSEPGFNKGWLSKCLRTSDGKIWIISNKDGMLLFDPSKMSFSGQKRKIIFDNITAGSKVMPKPYGPLTVRHDENDLTFDITDFNYSDAGTALLEYKLDGYDKEWVEMKDPAPVSYKNLRPGRYTMAFRNGYGPDDEISCHIRIKPVWYASVPAIVAEILIILSIIIYILRSRYAKAVLNEKLKLKNEEYEKQTSFFINLSFKMRTPINLIIGQLEQYFKDYGSRVRGVEDIQEVYKKTIDIRGMISEYVDTQNEALEREPRNARIINAVLGAIERNIFTKSLSVSLLCDELNMGKTKLTAVVKEATGMSPGEYIEDTRLRYAAEMLKNGNYTVGEISDRLGFSSASYFSTRFKKKYGVAPSSWKE